jgi:quercetin dioxygenase-like cupin family protein
MKINRAREAGKPSELRSETFTGEVWADPVLTDAKDVMINNVFFAPRARTHWHKHGLGQVLVVLAGQGQVWNRTGEGGRIAAGDVVHIEPGDEHWHGAVSDAYLLHLAISLGPADWLSPVTDEEYAQAD